MSNQVNWFHDDDGDDDDDDNDSHDFVSSLVNWPWRRR